MSTTCWAVTLPLKTKPKGNNRQHWRTVWARSKKEREAAYLGLRTQADCVADGGPPKRTPSKSSKRTYQVLLVRRSAGRKMDDDNLRDALKAVRDGVADWLELDDGDPRIYWAYRHERCRRGLHEVDINVMENTNDMGED